jgi:anti-sigma factor RsiW
MNNVNEWLSAYLDGELSIAEQREVEALLDDVQTLRELALLKRVRELVSGLDVVDPPAELRARIERALERAVALRTEQGSPVFAASEATRRTEWLSAYLDGELSERQQKAARRVLRRSAKARRRLREYHDLQRLIGNLPKAMAPASIKESAMARIRALAGQVSAPMMASSPVRLATTRWINGAKPARWLGIAAAIAIVGLAAPGMIGILRSPTDVATLDATKPHDAVRSAALSSDEWIAALHAELDQRPAGERRAPAAPSLAHSRPRLAPESAVDEARPNLDGLTLPAEKLIDLKRGDLVELDSRRVTLICLDVQKVRDRLHVILADRQISALTLDGDGKTGGRSKMYVVDVATSATDLSLILDDLIYSERQQPLIAGVDVSPFSTPEEATTTITPTSPLASPTGSSAERLLKGLSQAGEAANKVMPIIQPPRQPAGDADSGAKVAVAAKSPASRERSAASPNDAPRDPHERVRVIIVLQPTSARS